MVTVKSRYGNLESTCHSDKGVDVEKSEYGVFACRIFGFGEWPGREVAGD